jgi:uncharacterized membrane protein YphA (DoxX/SURF4 family)
MTPAPVARLLEAPWLALVARVLLTSAYWWGGFAKLGDFRGAVAEAAAFGLPAPALVAAITVALEVGASLAIIVGRGTWLAAGALGVFTLIASCLANAFWTMQGIERFHALNSFLEHLGLIGGLMLAAMLDRGKQS